MKYFLRHHHKAYTKEELIQAVKAYCESLSPKYYGWFISHLQKVIPKVIQVNGEASGY